MPKYANGSNAFVISDRSGFRYRTKDTRKEWNGLLVGKDEYEEKHPQLTPPRHVTDPQAIRDPRPDSHVDTYFGFKPVGGLNLEATGVIGKVTVTTS